MTDTAVKKSAESVKMPENGKIKHLSWQVIACVCLVAVSVVLNVVAWKSTAFCDWYTAHVFQFGKIHMVGSLRCCRSLLANCLLR